MLWFYTEDISYFYDEKFRDSLKLPGREEVIEKFRKGEKFNVLASYLPFEEVRPLFRVVELPNRHGLFTTQDMEYIQSLTDGFRKQEERKILEERLGLRIHRLERGSIRLIGAENIKRYVEGIKEIRDPRLKPKGVFLVGVPGTGKSYSAKYCASELSAYLVELNISRILESHNPVFTLHSIFKYLQDKKEKYVLWIDEIEKAFTGEEKERRMLGQLLTILNDLNTPTGYQIDCVFWVTANNILQIMNSNPEFLRRGRFDELFFVDNPREETAMEIASYYASFYGVKYLGDFPVSLLNVTKNVVYSKETMEKGAIESSRFIYTPAEIEQIAKMLAVRSELKARVRKTGNTEIIKYLVPKNFDDNKVKNFVQQVLGLNSLKDYVERTMSREGVDDLDLAVVVYQIPPLSVAMADAINVMRSQKKSFTPAD